MKKPRFLAGLMVAVAASSPAWAQEGGSVVPSDAVKQPFERLAQVRTSRDVDALELAFWNAIKDSTNPADFQAYLEAFPEGTFAPLARVRAQSGGGAVPVEDVDLDYVARVAANVRAQPTADSDRLGSLPEGARVQVTGRAAGGNWLRIALNDGGSGFVFGELLEPAGQPQPAAAPPAEQTPPPAPPQVATAAPRAAGPALQSLEALSAFRDCDNCPEMVVVPSGRFSMGDSRGDKSQQPVRDIGITADFAIGRYEVTASQWQACVDAGGCDELPKLGEFAEDSPVRNVSWDDALKYALWLSTATGRSYRLPTEAEWEYAARGGTQTTFSWGDNLEVGQVACRDCGGEWDRAAPGRVGTFEPNPLGLFDMHGSVAEWTYDCWHSSLDNTPIDGSAFDQAGCRQRVLRGGSWRSSNPAFLTSASRFFYDAPVRYIANGFRVVADR